LVNIKIRLYTKTETLVIILCVKLSNTWNEIYNTQHNTSSNIIIKTSSVRLDFIF